MIFRLFAAFIVIVAVAAGLAFISLPHDQLAHVMRLRDFFDVAIPVLGFGALTKYICSCKHKCGCCSDSCSKCGTGGKSM